MTSIETAFTGSATTATAAPTGDAPTGGFLAVLSSLLGAAGSASGLEVPGMLVTAPIPPAPSGPASAGDEQEPGSDHTVEAWPSGVTLATFLTAHRVPLSNGGGPTTAPAIVAAAPSIGESTPSQGGGDDAAATGELQPTTDVAVGAPSALAPPVGPTETAPVLDPGRRVGAAAGDTKEATPGEATSLPSNVEAVEPAPETGLSAVAERNDAAAPAPLSSTTTADMALGAPAPDAPDALGEPGPPETTGGARMLNRILDAVERLENAPPPRQLTLEVGELRVRISLEDGNVRMQLLGEQREAGQHLLRDAGNALRARGFDLEGDDRGRRGEGRDPQSEPGSAPSTSSTTPRRPGSPGAGLRL